MSINSALLAGASGLAANSTALAAISDNIANVNSIGYKRTETLFNSLVNSNQAGSYNAGGVESATRQIVTAQGQMAATGSITDLGIAGDGFFVVGSNPPGSTGTGEYLFTRAGSFDQDNQGYLRNAAGFYLQGWPIADDGTIASNPSSLESMEAINVGAVTGTAEATTQAQINANLRATTPISTQEATYDATLTANNMASGAVTADFESTVNIYDSQGGTHALKMAFLKSSANPNEWHVEVYADPASDVETGAGLVDGQVATGVVRFDANGKIDLANSTLPASLSFAASDSGAPAAGAVKWATASGIGAQDVSLTLGGPGVSGGLTQFDSPSVLDSTSVNGSSYSDNPTINISDKGIVSAAFGNGVVKNLYQIPLATFINANGLVAESGGAYHISPKSGTFTLKAPTSGGAGEIAASNLESSNVDLATEFTSLIKTQRAYSASSKIITTADEMLDELIRMKR